MADMSGVAEDRRRKAAGSAEKALKHPPFANDTWTSVVHHASIADNCSSCPVIGQSISVSISQVGLEIHATLLLALQGKNFLVNHIRSHKTCRSCGREYSGKKSTERYKKHIRSCRGPKEPGYGGKVCRICGKVFTKAHNRRNHETFCSPSCMMCGKRFQTRMGLRAHKCPAEARQRLLNRKLSAIPDPE